MGSDQHNGRAEKAGIRKKYMSCQDNVSRFLNSRAIISVITVIEGSVLYPW